MGDAWDTGTELRFESWSGLWALIKTGECAGSDELFIERFVVENDFRTDSFDELTILSWLANGGVGFLSIPKASKRLSSEASDSELGVESEMN